MAAIRFLAVLISAAILLGACAGGASVSDEDFQELKVSLSTETEVKEAYGYTYAVNPFLAPPRTIGLDKIVFLVLRFVAAAPASLEFAGVELAGERGRLKTQVLDKEGLKRFWESRTIDDGSGAAGARNDKKFALIERYALDFYGVNALRRNSPYSLLILGPKKDEIGAARLTVRYYVNGEYRERTFPVTF